MKNLIKVMTSFLVAFTLLSTFTIVAFATDNLTQNDFNENEKGSIAIDLKYDGEALDNIEFKVYHITTVCENNNHTLCSKYSSVEIDHDLMYNNDYWIKLRNNLQNYINYNAIEPERSFYTDHAGSYNLEDLDLGIYYIEAQTTSENGITIFSEPTLVNVGHYDNSEEKWVYDYNIKPKVLITNNEKNDIEVKKVWKNTNSEILIPDEIEIELYCNGQFYDKVTLSEQNQWSYTWQDIKDCDSWAIKELGDLENFVVDYEKDVLSFTVTNTYIGQDDEKLPQTGSMFFITPLFAGVGIVFVLLGVLLRNKNNYKKEEINEEFYK